MTLPDPARTIRNPFAIVRGAALLTALLFILVQAFPAFARPAARQHKVQVEEQIVSKFVGKNWVNGKSWAKLEYAGKLGYVCGLFDGFTVYYSKADGVAGLKKTSLAGVYKELSIPSHLTVGDVVNGMDEFYQTPENMRLPAICAYLYFIHAQRGEKEDHLKKRLETWRRMFID